MSKEIRELLEEASFTMLDMANAWVNYRWVNDRAEGKKLHDELSNAWKKREQALALLDKRPEAGELSEQMREILGAMVRRAWVSWAKEQINPKPSWLVGWAELSEDMKEADRRIGDNIASYYQNIIDRLTEQLAAGKSGGFVVGEDCKCKWCKQERERQKWQAEQGIQQRPEDEGTPFGLPKQDKQPEAGEFPLPFPLNECFSDGKFNGIARVTLKNGDLAVHPTVLKQLEDSFVKARDYIDHQAGELAVAKAENKRLGDEEIRYKNLVPLMEKGYQELEKENAKLKEQFETAQDMADVGEHFMEWYEKATPKDYHPANSPIEYCVELQEQLAAAKNENAELKEQLAGRQNVRDSRV